MCGLCWLQIAHCAVNERQIRIAVLDACNAIPNHIIHCTDEQYITTSLYIGQKSDEIGFEKGVIVKVLKKSLDGWWMVRLYVW